jgi:hypothetical protein
VTFKGEFQSVNTWIKTSNLRKMRNCRSDGKMKNQLKWKTLG